MCAHESLVTAHNFPSGPHHIWQVAGRGAGGRYCTPNLGSWLVCSTLLEHTSVLGEITSMRIIQKSRRFRDFLGLVRGSIRTYFSQASIYHRKSVADSFLLMVRKTPSSPFLRLPPRDSERSATSDFTIPKEKKSPLRRYSANGTAGGSS